MSEARQTRRKIVVVVGATGTGKSKLALQLAEWLGKGAVVVNADAMQCYEGLDTLTNKASAAERARVRHCCLAHRDPLAPDDYDVRAWVAEADRAIEGADRAVVVGGTHYYVEALLWRNVLSLTQKAPGEDAAAVGAETGGDGLDEMGNAELHALLEEVDPKMAERLHANNRRKVLRAIRASREAGRPVSELLEAQQSAPCAVKYFPLVLWVDAADLTRLDERLDERVDEMAAGTMFEEIAALKWQWEQSHAPDSAPDFERRIFQAIGLRQLWGLVKAAAPGSAEAASELVDTSSEAYRAALAEMKQCTRRYARQQLRWIKNRLQCTHSAEMRFVHLVLSDPARWDEEVLAPAKRAVEELFRDGPMQEVAPAGSSEGGDDKEKEKREAKASRLWTARTCEACKRVLHGDAEWDAHVRSSKHKTHVKRARLEASKSRSPEAAATVSVAETDKVTLPPSATKR